MSLRQEHKTFLEKKKRNVSAILIKGCVEGKEKEKFEEIEEGSIITFVLSRNVMMKKSTNDA